MYRIFKVLFVSILSIVFSFCTLIYADQEPPKIGNFALPNSQQPSPLIGFGENIIDKDQKQLFLFADDYAGVNEHYVDVIPSLLYGITDNVSIFINAPVAASYQSGNQHSAGIEDAFVQLEYAYYNKTTSTYVDQFTLIANVAAPTGSIQKNPYTGFGSPSYFLGMTFNRTYADWFVFGSPGADLTTAKNGTKFGNSFLYQIGFGKNITNINGWILAWMVEGDGTYTQKNRIRGTIDPNSGGNIVYVTPSIWASTKKLIFQFGAGLPVTQHFNGSQPHSTYLIAANFGWTV